MRTQPPLAVSTRTLEDEARKAGIAQGWAGNEFKILLFVGGWDFFYCDAVIFPKKCAFASQITESEKQAIFFLCRVIFTHAG